MILAIIGIILSLVGIILHFYYREKKIVRLSSPNLNLLVGIGAIILYMDIIITVIPTTSKVVNTILCNLTPWMTALGYSLCYGTILVKMGRVFYIFDNPTKKKKKFLKDKVLFLGVGILVAIDLIILTVYTAVEGAKGNLEANRVPHTENPQDIVGKLQKITNYFIYVCHNRSRAITLGILYGYKMLLQIVALVLSFSIRKVKIKGLNDAKYIAAAVYITSIVTAVIIVITYTLDTRINIFAAIFSTGFFIGTTAILGLVMIPPLIGYFRDPEGKTVFQNSASHNADNAISTYGNKTAKNTNTADVMSIEDGLKQEVSENGVNIRDEQK